MTLNDCEGDEVQELAQNEFVRGSTHRQRKEDVPLVLKIRILMAGVSCTQCSSIVALLVRIQRATNGTCLFALSGTKGNAHHFLVAAPQTPSELTPRGDIKEQ
jgi:hypothetical protein